MLFVISFLSFFQVILRNVFSSGFTWIDDIIRQGVVWLAVIGGSIAATYSKHISIDILPRILSPYYKRYLFAILYIIAIFVSTILIIASIKFLLVMKQSGEMISSLNIQAWYATLIFPVGMSLITLKFLIRFILNILNEDICSGERWE